MSIAVNNDKPFLIPQGPDLRDTYYIGETVSLSWTLPSNVSVSLEYTNTTDDSSNLYIYSWALINNQTNQNFLFWLLDPLFIQPADQGQLKLSWYPGGPGYGNQHPQFAKSPTFHVKNRKSTSAEVGIGVVVPLSVLIIAAGVWWYFRKRTSWGYRARKRESRELVR